MKAKAVSGYREFDLTTCEVCGMWWTASSRELCPRCMLAAAKEMGDEARRRLAAVMREIETLHGETAIALARRFP